MTTCCYHRAADAVEEEAHAPEVLFCAGVTACASSQEVQVCPSPPLRSAPWCSNLNVGDLSFVGCSNLKIETQTQAGLGISVDF